MLDLGHQVQELVTAVGPLRCDVQLPSWWEEGLGRTGRIHTRFDERRRHTRYRLRACAALEYRQTFPGLKRANGWHQIFTTTLSRGGLSFLHHEQLFPRERMRILLPRRGVSCVEIVWSARVQEQCFHVGVRFVAQLHKFSQ